MKHYLKFLLIIQILFLFSCQKQVPEVSQQQVNEIRQKYITDKRLEYFDVSVKTEGTQSVLIGSTVSEPAFIELKELAATDKIEFEVKLLPDEDYKNDPWGIVTLSVCNIRAKNRHSAELVTQALLGTPVKIFNKKNGWYLVQTPDHYFGWVDGAAVSPKTNAEMQAWKKMPKMIFSKVSGVAYNEANLTDGTASDLVLGDLLGIEEEFSDIYKIAFPDGREAFVRKNDCSNLDSWYARNIDIDQVLKTAFLFKGVPYLWGGTSPKMLDCSGFTKTAYFFNGLILQRDASQQTLYGEEVDTSGGYENLQPGDLLFFGRKASGEQPERVTHVGLYIGNSRFIHASGKVRINSLDPNSEDYTGHYEQAFVRARRIVGNVDGRGIEWITDNEFYKQVLPK